MKRMIKLIKPYITYKDVENDFKEVFESEWFTKGKNVSLFAKKIRDFTGAEYSLLTTSATTALSACLKVLSISTGDEVIVSDFSFPASVNVIEDTGAKPIFADVDLETFNMMPEELEKKITQKTKAVIFVDTFGNPTGIHKIKEICRANNIPLIDDAACAIGSSENNIKSGNIADLTCFSFHPRKLLTTGEGGAITTNNLELYDKLAIKLNHGSVFKDDKYDFVDYGYNYRLSELQCVMGIKQIEKIENLIDSRIEMRNKFTEKLKPLDLKPQSIGDNVRYNVQSLVFIVPGNINRDKLIEYLKNENIETTIGTYCLSGTTYYREKYKSVQKNAEFLDSNTITLPCYDNVDVDYICNKIIKYS